MSDKIAFNCDVKSSRSRYQWETTGTIKPVYAFICPFTDTLVFGIFHGRSVCENAAKIRLERKNKSREFTGRISGQKGFVVSCLDTGKIFGESTYYAPEDVVGITHFHSFSGSLAGAVRGLRNLLPESNKTYTVRLTKTDGQIEKRRYFKNDYNLCVLPKGGRRTGFIVKDLSDYANASIVEEKVVTGTPAQRYADKLRKWARYILKNLHPNLWDNLKQEALSVTEERLREYEQQECKESHDAWESAPEFGLPRIEGHKTLTLTAAKAPAYVIEAIEKHLEKKEAFSYHWRGEYDYKVSAKLCDDGIYRAWFSAEFKGCLNGHYYLLLNKNNAIFCEND
ncbi:MAG: hypothetical protein HZB80_01960 [Deltaproteobacteria bacterium]|nr:hypothetical protein [Deltaproteobacteria bacterium]